MSFWDWLARTAEKSNEKYFAESKRRDEQRQSVRAMEQRRKDSIECCANCIYYGFHCGQLNHCIKHDFSFDMDDVKYNHIEYTRVCNDFFKK